MIITKLVEPWKHFIVENFFPDHLLQEIHRQFQNTDSFEPWTGYSHRFGKCISTHSPKVSEFMQEILPTFMKVCEEDLLSRGLPVDIEKYTVLNDMFCIDNVGYTVPIHTDNSQKCITFIIYVNGKGSCTSLAKTYGSERINSFASEEFRYGKCIDNESIDPIPNSALVFVPKNDVTYHMVEPTKETRHTIQFTIQLKIKDSGSTYNRSTIYS